MWPILCLIISIIIILNIVSTVLYMSKIINDKHILSNFSIIKNFRSLSKSETPLKSEKEQDQFQEPSHLFDSFRVNTQIILFMIHTGFEIYLDRFHKVGGANLVPNKLGYYLV